MTTATSGARTLSKEDSPFGLGLRPKSMRKSRIFCVSYALSVFRALSLRRCFRARMQSMVSETTTMKMEAMMMMMAKMGRFSVREVLVV